MRRVFEAESGGDVAEMKSLDVEYVFEFAREGGVRADVGAERILGQDVVRFVGRHLSEELFLHALGGGMEMGHALKHGFIPFRGVLRVVQNVEHGDGGSVGEGDALVGEHVGVFALLGL